ncbi:MAG: TonB-dependent receptor [Polyangiaceae bacterium]
MQSRSRRRGLGERAERARLRAACAARGVALALSVIASEARADDPPPPADAPPDPIDVSVQGEAKKEPDQQELTRAETRLVPGAFGDPFRVVESLPGVVPLASGLPYFYVRGAPPGDVGYTFDGIRVPLLYHLGLGPAVIHPALIQKVDLYPSGSTRLGRYVGGMVSGELSEPRSDPHAEANVRIVDAGALVEIPFAKGKGDVLASGRYSYTGPLFSLLANDTQLDYGDYAARFSYQFDDHHRLGAFFFGAYDYLGQPDELHPGENVTLVETMFHRADVRYDQRVDEHLALRHDVILGWEQTALGTDRLVVDRMLELRSTLVDRPDESTEIQAGLDVTIDGDSVDLEEDVIQGVDPDCPPYPDCFSAFFKSRTDVVASGWGEVAFHVGDRFRLVPGVRVDVYSSNDLVDVGVDPRVTSETTLAKGVTLTSFVGWNSQPPAFIVAGPGFRPPLDDGGLQHSLSTSIGLSWAPDPSWEFKATVYRTSFFDMNDALGTSSLSSSDGFPGGLDKFDERFDGTSTGLELSVKRRLTKKLGGLVSYSLGRADRIGKSGERVPSGFDRTHVANLALTYDFGSGWRGGVKNLFYSGTPILRRDADNRVVYDGRRLDPFYRFDARVEKRFTILDKGFLSIVLEMLNVFVTKESIGVSCDTDGRCTTQKLGPIAIPSIGVEGGF